MKYDDKKFAFCVTVYGGRKSPILDNLENIDTIFDIYIVTQEDDKEKEYYRQFLDKRENIFLLETKAKNIQEKRNDIVTDLRWEYDGHFQCDDDLLFIGYYITEESKRQTSNTYRLLKCDFNILLWKMLENSYIYDAALSGVPTYYYLFKHKPGTVDIDLCHQLVFIRHDKINEKNINYSRQGELYEDLDFTLTCLSNGLKAITAKDYGYRSTNYYFNSKDKSTIFNKNDDNETFFHYTINTAMKWKLPLYTTVKSVYKLRYRMRYKKFFDNPNPYNWYDETVDKLYKEKKYYEIYEYLLDKDLNKK